MHDDPAAAGTGSVTGVDPDGAANGRRSRPGPGSGERPLTARSVIASTLLGIRPSRLSTPMLVRSCGLFGIAEGTTRVAISRMVAAGELAPDDGGYRLTGPLLTRQDRQDASRHGVPDKWDGRWSMAVVVADGRTAATRNELRAAACELRYGELREGVWLRPDNLAAARSPRSSAVLDEQCRRFTAVPSGVDVPADLAADLWDLDGWAARARALLSHMDRLIRRLEDEDLDVLAPAFVTSAAVLRHFQADPLLPAALLPGDWPGGRLRAEYDRYDAAFKQLWRTWYRTQG